MKAQFVPFAPSLAHVSRCLAVAEAWRDKGHTAVFAVGSERAAIVQEAGFETRSVPEVPGAVFRADRGFRWLTAEYFARNLAAEQDILADVEPDVVVFDFRFTTASAARLASLPSVTILHGNGLRLALWPREAAQLLVGDPRDSRGIAALRLRVMHQLFPVGFQALMRMVARRLTTTLKAHGLPLVDSPFELLLGHTVLVTDILALLPREVPPNCHIVGPLMWSGWEGPAPWLDELDAQPLLYVTMGSTVEAQSALVKIVDALRDGPYNVVLSIGSLSLPPDLELPAHIHVFTTVPGATVARRCAAVLHHGGHETLLQALAAGVPSLMFPANPDQILVAQQAQALGVGRSIWRPGGLPVAPRAWDEMTLAQIRREIDSLITDQDCVRTCEAFKQEIQAQRGAAAAAEILEGIAEDVSQRMRNG